MWCFYQPDMFFFIRSVFFSLLFLLLWFYIVEVVCLFVWLFFSSSFRYVCFICTFFLIILHRRKANWALISIELEKSNACLWIILTLSKAFCVRVLLSSSLWHTKNQNGNWRKKKRWFSMQHCWVCVSVFIEFSYCCSSYCCCWCL